VQSVYFVGALGSYKPQKKPPPKKLSLVREKQRFQFSLKPQLRAPRAKVKDFTCSLAAAASCALSRASARRFFFPRGVWGRGRFKKKSSPAALRNLTPRPGALMIPKTGVPKWLPLRLGLYCPRASPPPSEGSRRGHFETRGNPAGPGTFSRAICTNFSWFVRNFLCFVPDF